MYALLQMQTILPKPWHSCILFKYTKKKYLHNISFAVDKGGEIGKNKTGLNISLYRVWSNNHHYYEILKQRYFHLKMVECRFWSIRQQPWRSCCILWTGNVRTRTSEPSRDRSCPSSYRGMTWRGCSWPWSRPWGRPPVGCSPCRWVPIYMYISLSTQFNLVILGSGSEGSNFNKLGWVLHINSFIM